MAGRFSVNKANPSVFISSDDLRDGGGSTVDSTRLSTASAGKPGSSVDAGNDETVADGSTSAVDHPEGNNVSMLKSYCIGTCWQFGT